jgi:hypothetical protein
MNQKALVIGARTVLIMLGVAALALLGIGVVVLLRTDPPEVTGLARDVFGKVFTVFAFGVAAVLGIPAGIGLWAMAGANAEGAVPVLSPTVRRALGVVGIVTVVAAAVVLFTNGVATGRMSTIVDIAMVALVAMGALGLAGATSFSTHRGRAIASAAALIAVALGTAWLLRAVLAAPG